MSVIAAYGVQCLVAGCRGPGAGQQGVRPGRRMLHDGRVCIILWVVYIIYISFILFMSMMHGQANIR